MATLLKRDRKGVADSDCVFGAFRSIARQTKQPVHFCDSANR